MEISINRIVDQVFSSRQYYLAIDRACTFSTTHVKNLRTYVLDYFYGTISDNSLLKDFTATDVKKAIVDTQQWVFNLVDSYASVRVAGEPNVNLFVSNVFRYNADFFTNTLNSNAQRNIRRRYILALLANMQKLSDSLGKIVIFDTSIIGKYELTDALESGDTLLEEEEYFADYVHRYCVNILASTKDLDDDKASEFYEYIKQQEFVGEGPFLFHCWKFANPDKASEIVSRVREADKEIVSQLSTAIPNQIRVPAATVVERPRFDTARFARETNTQLSRLRDIFAMHFNDISAVIKKQAEYDALSGVRESYMVFNNLVADAVRNRGLSQLARVHESGPFYVMSEFNTIWCVSKKPVYLETMEYGDMYFGHILLNIDSKFNKIGITKLDGGLSKTCQELNRTLHPHLSSSEFGSYCWGNLAGRVTSAMFGGIPANEGIRVFNSVTEGKFVKAVVDTDVKELSNAAERLSYYLSYTDLEDLLKAVWSLLSSWDSESPYIDLNNLDSYAEECAEEYANDNANEDEREDIRSDKLQTLREKFNNMSSSNRTCNREDLSMGSDFYVALMRQPFFKSLDPVYVKCIENNFSALSSYTARINF